MAKKDLDFKKAIGELEEINEWFSSEDIDLDEGLEKLKKGKELILACQERLDKVETEFIDIKDELENAGKTSEENLDMELDEILQSSENAENEESETNLFE
ncbi:exodeoxyribonuclease VII small subunit [candidate division WWE3 bacterium]|nr:exodeoxyribonuclease VII small subunit [candidate division WWE3 bacterium]